LAACIADPRDPARVIHRLDDILRARLLVITCGYEMPTSLMPCEIRGSAWHWACCRDRARDLPVSRPRWENAPTTRELLPMAAAA